jgi:hypothetical protein
VSLRYYFALAVFLLVDDHFRLEPVAWRGRQPVIILRESGDYAVRGPDVNGQTRQLRAPDGMYFTKAGARKLAWHLEKEIKPIMAAYPQVAAPPPEPIEAPSF